MIKYNLHVTQVPDHKAQVVLARIIVGSNSMVSMQQAVVMAANPPLLLFHNLERKELEQHIEQLNSLGVVFDISEIQDALDDSELNFGGRKEAPEPKPAPPPPSPPPPKAQPEPEPPKQSTPSGQSRQPTPPAHTPVHAAEHAYHAYQPGYRIGAIDDAARQAAAMREAEEASRKKSLVFTTVAVIVLLLIGVLMFNLPKNNKITIESAPGLVKPKTKPEKKSAPPKTRAGEKAGQNAAGAAGPDSAAHPDAGEPRVQPTTKQKHRANALVDSARASENDLMKSVAFYKMAISFNRQNLAAWQGLLQAYRELHMDSAANDTERQMREIFGHETLSVGNIVKSFGEIIDIHVNADGAHMVEYKTTKSSKVDILRDVFSMTRAVRAACNCHNISIHVSTGSGKEVTAHSAQHTSVHSLSEFMRQAEIVWQE